MSQSIQERNKALVLEAFDTLFNRRDYAAAERYWSPGYIQHSAHIAPGREGLFNLVKGLPATLKYEPGVIAADGDFVIVHGRFSGFGAPANWVAADILRIEDGALVEHWDVIQDEATREQSKSGRCSESHSPRTAEPRTAAAPCSARSRSSWCPVRYGELARRGPSGIQRHSLMPSKEGIMPSALIADLLGIL